MKYALTTLLLFTFFVECKKSVTTVLPPITATGANTFGCLANGNTLIPRDAVSSFQSPDPVGGMNVIFDKISKTFEINVSNGKAHPPAPFYLHLAFVTYDKIKPGDTYSWQKTVFQDEGTYGSFFDNSINDYAWFGSYLASGTTTITRFDTLNHIVSGIFSGTLRQRDGTHEISITEGRFDINWATLLHTKFP